jgi:DNA repair exonuclease SbcCD ATPase subunit
MLIKEAVFRNYKRFYVSGIKEMIYRPKKKIQVILGANGSGKSSLLKELIPNVDDVKNEYDTNGYRKVTYEHRNKTITISYDRDNNRHSFMVDGEEFNPSGLLKTQKQLINDYFGISKEVYGLLLSTSNFTNMSVNERKKWFTEILSTVDYRLALNVFNKAKERVNELKAYIKLTKSKILADKNRIEKYTDDYIKNLKDKINFLSNLIEKLLEEKETYKEIDLHKYINKIKELTDEGYKYYEKVKDYRKSDLQKDINFLKTKQDFLEQQKKKIKEKIEKIERLKIDENDNKASLEKELKKISDEITSIENRNVYGIDLSKIDTIANKLNEIQIQVLDIISGLQELGLTTESIDNFDKIKSKHRELDRDHLLIVGDDRPAELQPTSE